MAYTEGEFIGPYRVVSLLGQGGMATVYKAYDPELDRYVAIKVMHEAFKEDPNFFERFRREARIIARLEHPNIVPVYSFSEHRGDPYIVMKFIDGETLKAVLGYGPLALEAVNKVLQGVAAGLSYAHKRGVLHRDIKPSNVMVDRDDVIYLADFGLARLASMGASTISQDMMLGTPHYISPEQAQGQTDLDLRTDIYSLGVVLYQLVVGRVPFMGDTPFSIVHDHIYTPLPLPTSLNSSVPAEIEAVLLKALAKNRDDRYESADALAEAFDGAVRATQRAGISPSVATPAQDATETDIVRDQPAEMPTPTAAAQATPRAQPVEPTLPRVVGPAARVSPAPVENRYGQYWLLGGAAALVAICLLFSLGVLSAFSTAIPGSGPPPALGTGEASALEAIRAFAVPDDPDEFQQMLDEAERAAAANPADAAAQFQLMMLKLHDPEQAQASPRAAMAPFVQAAGSDKDLLLAAARALVEDEQYLAAAAIYLHVMEQHPDDVALRQEGGAFLWQFASNAGRLSLPFYKEIAESTGSAGARVLYARALISVGRPLQLREARAQLDLALAGNGALPEVHLTLGLLDLVQGDPSDALNELQYAMTAPDAPAWVREEAQRLIDEHNLLAP